MEAQESSFGQLTQTPAVSSSTLSSSLEQQLCSAITSGNVKRTHQIISEVASPEINQLKLGPDGLSPLHVACEHGQEEIVQLLLAECECSIESCNSKGQSALHIAAQNGHIEIVKVLHQNWNQLSKREQLGSNDTGSSHELDQKSKPVSDGVSSKGLPHISSSTGHLDSSPSPVDTATQETLSEPSGLVASFSSPGPRAQGLSASFQLSCDISGNTALHLAAAGGQVPVVQYLLYEADYSPTLTNNENQNAVHLAAKYGHVTIVRALVEAYKERQRSIVRHSFPPSDDNSAVVFRFSTPDINGDTPLHLASANGQLLVVQFLLCEVQCSLTLVNNEKQNAIHLASKHGHVGIVKFLVQTFYKKQDSHLPVKASEGSRDCQSSVAAQDPSKESSVTPVSQSHRSASLCELLTGDINGESPLHLAIANRQLPVVNYLLHEVNCNLSVANNRGQNLLHLAVMLDSHDVVEMLIQAIRDRKKKTVCSSDNDLPGIEQEISVSLDNLGHNGKICLVESQPRLPGQCGLSTSQINGTDCDGNTVLHLAAVHGNLPVAEYLLHEEDCSPTLANKTGQTALHMAAKQGHINIVKVLVEKLKQIHTSKTVPCPDKQSSKVSTPDNNGDTPLHLAAAHGHLPTVQYLLHEAKCSPTLVNHEGQSALHLAAKHGKMATVKCLIEEGCSSTATDKHGRIPLYLASEGGHLDIVKYFTLDRQCDPTTKTTKRWVTDENKTIYSFAPGLTPLHIASHRGHLDTVRFLVDELACDPCCTDEDGSSSCYFACQEGHTEIITYFIEKLQLESPLSSALLHVAARNGCIDEIKHLIDEKKYSPTYKINRLGFHDRISLHFASIGGHLLVLKYLVDEQQVDPACVAEDGVTSLHIASGYGHLKVVEYLVEEKQCDVSCRTSTGDTPLHYAALGGHLDTLKYFIIEKHCSPMERNQVGMTPLHCASQGGHLVVIKFLVDEQQVNPACTNENGNTSLHEASGNGHLEAVKYLVDDKESDVSCINSNGDTPLLFAALNGHLDILKYFINVKHCSPLERNKKGMTSLHYASNNGHLVVIKFLVDEKQVNPACANEDGDTSLCYASGCGHLEAVKYFVDEKQCNILCRNNCGDTPLHHAAIKGHLHVLKYFIAVKHCNPMEGNKTGIMPLHCAIQGDHLTVVQYLVEEENCNVMSADSFGATPLHYAAYFGSFRITHYLVDEKNCNVMANAEVCRTPFHLAAEKGHLRIVKYLADHNADPFLPDKEGLTPLHLAIQNGYLDIVKYLVEEKHCDPGKAQALVPSPIEAALKLCTPGSENEDIAVYLLSKCTVVDESNAVVKLIQKKLPSSVNVFIIGYRSSGKSTLTKAICDESSPLSGRFFDVKCVISHTAGIVPVEFQSKIFGKITLFDFAGHEEYYGSHETLLESIAHPVILLTVDLQLENSQLLKALKYWMSFVSRAIKKAKTQANVILVGSHSDKLKEVEVQAKTSLLNDFVQNQQFEDVNCVGWVNMDCRKSSSRGMTRLREILGVCCKLAQPDCTNLYTNLLHLFIFQKHPHREAITFNQLLDTLVSSDDDKLNLLKSPPRLLEACESLSASGHIIFLKRDEIEKCWIVINKEAILSMAHGILKCIHTDDNNAGIVPLSLIEEKAANPSLVIEYMLKMEFCSEVDPRSLQLIKGFHQKSPGRHFFFPDLISAKQPDMSQINPQYTYSFGWTLRCNNLGFFTPRFLQLLFVHLVCKFALIPHPNTPTLFRAAEGCRIWKNGIRWVSANFVEATVEVTEMNTAVVVVLRCIKDNYESMMYFLQLRSELIKEVFSTKCETSEIHESVYLPQCLKQYPDVVIPVSEIARAIVNKGPSIVIDIPSSSQYQNVKIGDLLLYEPFEKFGAELIRDLFSHQNSCEKVPSEVLDLISVAAEGIWKRMALVLEVDISKIRRIEHDQSKTDIDKCRSILHHWSQSKGTYSQLCQQLSSYSVFAGRNPLDFCPHDHLLPEAASAMTTERVIPSLTMASVPTLKQLQNFEKGDERLKLFPELVPYWEELAAQLDFPICTIKQIKIDNRWSVVDQCQEMLSMWLGPQPPSSQEPTWESLITAMKNIDLGVLASNLERMIKAPQ